ncbi:MAG: winged helix-turn-helix transcriptional regulator [Proteobacteria bacterium]|nr:winged helix-turn-helix transcriptional regulator [Pseudomonadota bacterium]
MLTRSDYISLSDFRYQLARFLGFSERASRAAGITPTQYLLLLHIRGHAAGAAPGVGELAQRLQASPHGTTALIERCRKAGLVDKRPGAHDRRRAEVLLTARGRRLVERVAARHRPQLTQLHDVFRLRIPAEAARRSVRP